MRDLNGEAGLPASRPVTPPLLSLIIPVLNLHDYISSCLDSICDQAFRDIEIIVVDGGSDDDTPEQLAKRSIDEPRLTVITTGRIGPGSARNLGAQEATGDYVWFVDGDDLIAEECLLGIADRLEVTRPDVLLINHEIVHPNGKHTPSSDSQLLLRGHPDSFTIAERPWLIDLRMVSWNKIVSRAFLARTGARFLSEFPHEDVPVSCRLLLEGCRLSVLPDVCYYQLDRPGSIMKSGDARRHFRVFDAWEPILMRACEHAESDDGQVTAEVYRALFQRAIWHFSTILDTGGSGVGKLGTDGYIARADRKQFFTKISELYKNYVPDGYQPPAGLRGVKFRLFARNQYAAYEALDPPNQMRMAVVRRIRPT